MKNNQSPAFLVHIRKILMFIGIGLMLFTGIGLLLFPSFDSLSTYVSGGIGAFLALLARFLPDSWLYRLGLWANSSVS